MSVAFDKVWIVLKQGLSPLQEDIQGADAMAGIGRQPDENPDPYEQPSVPNSQGPRCKKCGQPLDYRDYGNPSGLCRRCQQYGGDIKRDQGREPCQNCNGSGQIPDPWNNQPMYDGLRSEFPQGNLPSKDPLDFQKSGGILGQFNRVRGLYKNYESDPWGPKDPWGPPDRPYPNDPDPYKRRSNTIPCPKCRGRGWVEKGSPPSPWGQPHREGDAGANA